MHVLHLNHIERKTEAKSKNQNEPPVRGAASDGVELTITFSPTTSDPPGPSQEAQRRITRG